MKFLVVEGTVRKGRRSITVAQYVSDQLSEAGHAVDLFDMAERDIPLLEVRRFKDDDPAVDVEAFGRLVEECDGMIIVTPEYNHQMPGALKNLLDYLRPEYEDKPFSYITVSNGSWGGVRVQQDLNRFTVTVNAHPGPSLPVAHVSDVFSSDGELVDESYVKRFDEFLKKAVNHTDRFA